MIQLQSVQFCYDEKPAFTAESLCITQGEFVALVGPNGSGKTSLLKLLAGQLKTDQGQITLDGSEIHSMDAPKRSLRVAYFPQHRPMPNMDVYTLVSHGRFPHLGFGRVMQKEDLAAVEKALAMTNLADMSDRQLNSLSGGERQRAYLAMLVAQDSDFLLLDEPGTFLDISYQIEVLDILSELNKTGKTIICAIHDLPAAFSYAKRIVVLNKGAVLADGKPSDLIDSNVLQEVFGVSLMSQAKPALFDYTLSK